MGTRGCIEPFLTFSTGVTDDIDHARAVVLKAKHNPRVAAGMLFTVEEMDERGKAGWKAVWMDLDWDKSPQVGEAGMLKKNAALSEYMRGWDTRPLNQDDSSKSDSWCCS